MRISAEVLPSGRQHGADAGEIVGFQIYDAQIRQHTLAEDHPGDQQHRSSDDGADGIGQNVAEDDPPVGCPQSPGTKHIFRILYSVSSRRTPYTGVLRLRGVCIALQNRHAGVS